MGIKDKADKLRIKLRKHFIAGFAVRISHKLKMVVVIGKVHTCGFELCNNRSKCFGEFLHSVLSPVLLADTAYADRLTAESLVLVNYCVGVVDNSVKGKVGNADLHIMLFAELCNLIVAQMTYSRYLNRINAHFLKSCKHAVKVIKSFDYRMEIVESKSKLHNE